MKEFVISKNDEGQKLKKLCMRILDKAPGSFTYKMLRKKNITLNDKKATGDEVLNSGDIVKFFLADETFTKFASLNDVKTDKIGESFAKTEESSAKTDDGTVKKKNGPADVKINKYNNNKDNTKSLSDKDIIYIDDDILIINKEYGVLSQKAKPDDVSINEMMLSYLSKKGLWTGSTFKPSVCNRLDRNTTGIILAGISIKGLQLLTGAVRDRKIDKYYRTICMGRFDKARRVRSYLLKDEKNNIVKILSEEEFRLAGSPKSYSLIETEFRPVSYSKDGKLTLLEVKLITGKSHQIRAQLAKLGHPIIGDRKYSGSLADSRTNSGTRTIGRKASDTYDLKAQLLHAYKISFREGCEKYTGKDFTCPYPEAFNKIITDNFDL